MSTGLQTQLADRTTLDGAGAGQVAVYAPGGGDLVVTLQTVATSTATKVPTALIYRNAVTAVNQIEGSYTGSNDSSDTRIVLHPGESLICALTGVDAGAFATYRISGVLYPPGQAPAE